jgi:MOSC domain-containing protein YiiM
MGEMQAMIERVAQPGRLVWIGLRPARRAPMVAVARAEIDADGLVGDRSRAGPRAITLIQAEHLPAIAAYLGREEVAPDLLRRNLVIAGINLASLKGRRVRIGEAELAIGTICAPCSRMEAALGPGGYAALRGHGGWCAEVVRTGVAARGGAVAPVD